jgi:uncharacterized MAPEG superfamily protein
VDPVSSGDAAGGATSAAERPTSSSSAGEVPGLGAVRRQACVAHAPVSEARAARAAPDDSGAAAQLHPRAALVLVAQVAGISNEATASGAVLFLWGRVAHAIIYIAGIPYLRTVAFAVALIGMLRIAGELLSHWSSIGPAA